jgi:hypothetical protein
MFAGVCEQAGIKRYFTAPFTPQQNGVVERRNRSVMDMARALLKSMKVPGRYWAEAVRHVHLLNRLPTKVLGPYEAWTGRKPNLGHLKVFGCTAHAKVVTPHLKKLDDRSKKLVYFGVEEGSKAYRLYDPESNKIIVSRDTVFEEHLMWDWSANSAEGNSVEFVDEGEPAGNYTGSGEVDDQHCWQEMPTGSETEVVVDNSEALSDGLQWQANEEVQVDNQSEPVNAKFNTPENSVSAGISSTPDWSSNQPLRFRNLNEIYDNSEEVELGDSGVELADSDVEALLIEVDEPTKYSEAACHQEWIEAMNKEIQSIEKNRTWELVKLPAGKRPIGVKWVYKLKRNSDGEVVKHKARLVAKGYV